MAIGEISAMTGTTTARDDAACCNPDESNVEGSTRPCRGPRINRFSAADSSAASNTSGSTRRAFQPDGGHWRRPVGRLEHRDLEDPVQRYRSDVWEHGELRRLRYISSLRSDNTTYQQDHRNRDTHSACADPDPWELPRRRRTCRHGRAQPRDELGRRLNCQRQFDLAVQRSVAGRDGLFTVAHGAAPSNVGGQETSRDFTVPGGKPSKRATSWTSCPSIAASTMTSRSFSGSESIARQSC